MNGINEIQDDLPIIFNDCDHAFISNEFNLYCNKGEFEKLDGGLLTFESNEPKYSFLQMDESGNVIHTVEKKVVSNHAICGDTLYGYPCYYIDRQALHAYSLTFPHPSSGEPFHITAPLPKDIRYLCENVFSPTHRQILQKYY